MGRATGWTTCSWNLIGGGLRLWGGLELKRTGLGDAARQAPGSPSDLAEAAGDRQPQRSRTSSSLEALLWWSLWRWGRADTHFLLSPQLIRSSSSSEECRSRLASRRRRRRRSRDGEMAPWLCCWLVAKGVRAQFLRLSGEVLKKKKKETQLENSAKVFFNSHIVNNVDFEKKKFVYKKKSLGWHTYLCQFVQAPGSRLLSHHSPLPLHCHDKKSGKQIWFFRHNSKWSFYLSLIAVYLFLTRHSVSLG